MNMFLAREQQKEKSWKVRLLYQTWHKKYDSTKKKQQTILLVFLLLQECVPNSVSTPKSTSEE